MCTLGKLIFQIETILKWLNETLLYVTIYNRVLSPTTIKNAHFFDGDEFYF